MSVLTSSANNVSASATAESPEFVDLKRQLQDTRNSAVRQQAITRIGWLIVGLCLALICAALADYRLEFSRGVRAAWLGSVVVGMGFFTIRGLLRFVRGCSLSATVVEVEEHVVQFGQRLRTALDYQQQNPQPVPASASLLAALQADTCQVARKTNWTAAVDVRPGLVAITAAVGVVLLWGCAVLTSPEFRIASARALLIPLEYTLVTYSPETTTIPLGEQVEIRAEISGRPIAEAQVRYREVGADAEWKTVGFEPVEEPTDESFLNSKLLRGSVIARLDDLQRDVEFEVIAGPRPLPQGRIRVLQPLTVENISTEIVPPDYTHLAPFAADSLDLKVPEGSQVRMTLALNRPAVQSHLMATAEPARESEANELVPQVAIDGSQLQVTLADVRQSRTYVLDAVAADGMQLEPQRVSIRVQLDRPPEVRFRQPPEELVVTATTEVPMLVEARDDMGLHKVGILYQVGSQEPQLLWEHDYLGATDPIEGAALLELESLNVTYRDAITYYAFAEDQYFSEIRRTTTPLRYIDIRPYKMSFQLAEGGGSCNGNSASLEELIHRQRQILGQSFDARHSLPSAKPDFQGLAATQSELLEVTQEFAAGIEQRAGPVLSLSAAVAAMEQATKSLTEQQLPEGISAEQEALADLIATRENMRKLLNQSSSSSASACRKFDREQRQKLRMPEKKSEQQQQAETRKKLDALAQRERNWSKACQQCSNPSSSSGGSSSQSQSSPQESSEKSPSENPVPKTAEELAAEQRALQQELSQLEQQVARQNSDQSAASQQAAAAAQAMQQALDSLKQSNPADAAQQGEQAARQLEKLAQHLSAMQSRDFGQRLEQARQLAQQIARREEAVEEALHGGSEKSQNSGGRPNDTGEDSQPGDRNGNPSRNEGLAAANGDGNAPSENGEERKTPTQRPDQLAGEQRELAGDVDLLHDQLRSLEKDASREKAATQSRLSRLLTENPPAGIADLLRRSATDLNSRRTEQAARSAAQASERLSELSRGLAAAESDFAQLLLEEMMAVEEQLARLREQSRRAAEKNSQGQAAAGQTSQQQQWEGIGSRLDRLAERDKKLAGELQKAAAKEGRGERADPARVAPEANLENTGDRMPAGHVGWLELPDDNGLRQISKVLQSRIQEAILAGALQDADQPIPPEYRDLVEKYYRALSDDLR
jgi:hypothetical protein